MLLKDLVTLAKAGFTPTQVKEILSMDIETPVNVSEEAEEATAKESVKPDPQNEPAETNEIPLQNDIISAMEKQLQEMKKQLEENKRALEKAQKDNAAADISTNVKQQSDEEALADLVRGYMD